MTKVLIGPAYPLRGGIADFNQALAYEYIANKIPVKIFTFSLQYPSILFPGKTQYSDDINPKNLEISVCINSINPLNWIKVARKITQVQPEYVIIHYWTPFMSPCLGTIARRIKRKTQTKVIGIIHNVLPHEPFPFQNKLIRYFINSCDGFISMSKSVISDLNKFTNNLNKKFSPHPIYNIFGDIVPKEEALKHLNLNPDYQYILFFGIIRKYKGLDLLLRALANQKLKTKRLKLIVAGEFYEDQTYYLNLISDLEIEEKIIFTNNFVSSQKVKYYFSASSIVAQTYKKATQSGVTQIAYNFERPMLITNVGGLSEIVPHKKVGYVTETNPESISDALFDFFENSREKEFSKNVSLEKQKFGWDKLIQAIEELL